MESGNGNDTTSNEHPYIPDSQDWKDWRDSMSTTSSSLSLTSTETQALQSLRNNIEDGSSIEWGRVYLDNAKPAYWSSHLWSGVLGSLAKKGLYREDDGYARGLVLLPT